MFLKEFSIRRYGPLPDYGKRILGHFNLFYGSNEEGKTLTIDALLKMLFEKKVRFFKGVARVDEFPEGYIILENGERQEFKLPEAGTVSTLFNLSPEEFGNIFVIRDSDLSIYGEDQFYRSITGRLTGIRSEEIKDIKRELQELGSITPTGEFQNVAPAKLKDRIARASGLLERLEYLLDQMHEEGFARFEERLAGLEARRREINDQLNNYNSAYNRELYEKGREALDFLHDTLAELERLQQYNEDEYQAWQRAESSFAYLQEELEKLKSNIDEQKERLQAAQEEHKTRARSHKKSGYSLNLAMETVEPRLIEYDRRCSLLQRREVLADGVFVKSAGVVSTLVFLISLIGVIVSPALWLYLLLAVSLAAGLTCGWLFYSLADKKSRLVEHEARVCSEAQKAGLPAQTIEEARAGLAEMKNNLALESEMLKEAEDDLKWQQREDSRLKDELEHKQKQIKEVEETVNQFRRKSGVDTPEQYGALLKRRLELENGAEKQKYFLEDHFGKDGDSTEERFALSFWGKKVEALSNYASAVPHLKYDQYSVNFLKEELSELDEERKELEEKLHERSEEMRDIEREINENIFTGFESRLPCQTTVDLEAVMEKIKKWLSAREAERECALLALQIFDDLEKEEEQKVSSLFDRPSPVSEYFRRITEGRYSNVIFDSGENMIKAISPEGSELSAAQLSGGAYDQLYFAIRLALGERLLEGEKGFFILDDPFIKADPERLRIQLAMLEEIVAAGWQVLYFSAKGEVKDAMQNDIAKERVKEFMVGFS